MENFTPGINAEQCRVSKGGFEQVSYLSTQRAATLNEEELNRNETDVSEFIILRVRLKDSAQ